MNKKDFDQIDKKYIIRSNGDIYSRATGLKRKPYKNIQGYLSMGFWLNGGMRGLRVHRLVAFKYLEKDAHRNQVNHKNGIKSDNRVSNLEWATPSENTKHSFTAGLATNKGTNNANCKLNEETVIFIFKNKEIPTRLLLWAVDKYISIHTIRDIKAGRSWPHITSAL